MAIPSLDEIRESFAFFDNWEDRYKFIIDLGRGIPPMAEALKIDANIVRGCQSQVWIDHRLEVGRLYFTLDSDAMIVRPAAPPEPYPGQRIGRAGAAHPRNRDRGRGAEQRLTPPNAGTRLR